MENFWKENLGIFHNVKKIEIYFPRNTFVNKEFFFSRIFRDGIKNISHNIWKIFGMAKLKHSNTNF